MKPLPLYLVVLATVIIFAGIVVSGSLSSPGIAWLTFAISLLIISLAIVVQYRQGRISRNHS